MDKIQLTEEIKGQYMGLIQAAQQMENALGSATYKLYKLQNQRAEVDKDLKKWWDTTAAALNLDKTKDYFVDNDGMINIVERPQPPQTPPATPTEEVKDPDVVEPKIAEPPIEPPVEDTKVGGTVESLT